MKPAALALWGASIVLLGCSARPNEIRPGRDLAVLQSPNGLFQAIVREVNIDGSVMVSQPYQVLLQGPAAEMPRTQAVLIADKTEPLRIAWADKTTLLVCYSDAHIHNFDSHFYFGGQQLPLSEVDVQLVHVADEQPCVSGNTHGA